MNWKTFKDMPLKKKLQWILHYYGIWIVVSVVAVCVVVTLVGRILGPGEENLVKVMILDDHISDDERIGLGEELRELLEGPCEVSSYHLGHEYQYQSFVVRLSGAGDLDLILAPEAQMKELLNNGYFKEIHPMPEDSYYYHATDPDRKFPERDIYYGETGNREIEEDILLRTEKFFVD
ncbi:MAG: hypothetical protein KBT01_04000 [Clostridiales bacterium]|nr:hypothetical protein [Candidatus Blautia equi]